jgi:alkylation response protein AidB-like acyl-CoA dehydrogenase
VNIEPPPEYAKHFIRLSKSRRNFVYDRIIGFKNRRQPMNDAVISVLEEEGGRTDAEGKWPERSMKAMAEAGLLGLTLPRDAGGKGASMREFADATEQIARHCASSAMSSR